MPILFSDATNKEIEQALVLAEQAFYKFRKISGSKRANFLIQIGKKIEKNRQDIISICAQETSLGKQRLEMELFRTIEEIKMFAQVAINEEWQCRSSPKANFQESRPLLVKKNIPVGPVVVIGACNFPLAISVVGTDTASALSVGCTVVVKGHPAHPRTCQILADLVKVAMVECEMPSGTFQLIHGENYEVTQSLVAHPSASCIAFTGSLQGGTVLAKIVSQREKPIPFHAEMGSLNPVIALPQKVENETAKLALDYVQAVNLFAGQMCTKPGALFILQSSNHSSFLQCIKNTVNQQEILPMLNGDIYDNYEKSSNYLKKVLPLLATNESNQDKVKNPAYCRIFGLSSGEFIQRPELRSEAFGPSSLLIQCKTEEELFNCIESFEGSLTASLHCSKKELSLGQKIFPILESKVGRLLWNGFPPGVTPGPATHHGGPWPATTDSRYTSIGKEAYQRFVRPLCKQGFPEDQN